MSAGPGMEGVMNPNHIEGMVRKLKPVLTDAERAQAILKRYWRTRMALVWEVEDVHRAANEREVALTDEEAIEVLRVLHHQHNKQYGIKWQDLTDLIKDKVLGRDLTKREILRFVAKDIITINK